MTRLSVCEFVEFIPEDPTPYAGDVDTYRGVIEKSVNRKH